MDKSTEEVYKRLAKRMSGRLDREFTKAEAVLCLQPLHSKEVQHHLDLLVERDLLSLHSGFYSIVCKARRLAMGKWV